MPSPMRTDIDISFRSDMSCLGVEIEYNLAGLS